MKHDEKIVQPRLEEQNGEVLLTRAMLETATYDVEANTVDVVFATDEPALIRGYDGDPFLQVLSLDPAHINLRRLSNGAPVLDNHKRDGSVRTDVLGVVENPQLHGSYGTARLRFSNRKDLDDFRKDVKEGIIKNVSCGFRVKLYRDITQPDDQYRRLLAIEWEPSEISMVPVPETYNTQTRSMAEPIEQLTIENKQLTETQTRAMSVETENKTAVDAAAEQSKADAVGAERKRSMEIMDIAKKAGLDETFVTKHINDGSTADHVRSLAIDHFANHKPQVDINPSAPEIKVGEDHKRAQTIAGVQEALIIRETGSPDGGPKTELGKIAMVRRVPLIEHARALVGLGTPASIVQTMSDGEIYHRAMTSTDFPSALANVMNKKLRGAYAAVTPVWEKFATKVSANDFKDLHTVQVDGSFIPDELTEQGEYKEASFKEVADKFKLKSWGKMVKLSRQMIINDDLSAFQNNASKFAKGFINRKAQIVYGLLEGQGRILASGNTLFHADHNNYKDPGTAMSIAAFDLAKTAMRRQKDLSGEPIHITPRYLVIPPELEVLAYQLINATITPNTTSQANPFKGAFEILVDPFLTNTQEWYLMADPSEIEVIKYATLAGQDGIYTEQQYDFNTDELKIKARTDFNATVEEYRGVYKNKGVSK